MGIDISLMQVQEVEVASQNITHNLSDLWRELGIYDDLYNSEDKKAYDIILPITEAVLKLNSNLTYYKKFDSANGWGKAENGLRFLKDLLCDLTEHPNATIRISK